MSASHVEDVYELSPLQQGMLYHSVLDPDTGSYVYDYVFQIPGALDLELVEASIARIVARHAILRTSFHYEDLEKPVQVVHREATVPLEVHDVRDRSRTEQQELIRQLSTSEEALRFDLDRTPLMRMALVRTDDDVHQMVWVFHHLILDGWSVPVLVGELAVIYGALLAGQEPLLPPAQPYRDFIDWLQRRDGRADEVFWRDQLAGFENPTQLNVPQSTSRGSGFCDTSVVLSEDSTAELTTFARSHGLTLNAMIQAAWGLLLARYSRRDDVVFGTSAAGRPPELEGIDTMVGVCINTNPMRVRCRPDQPVLSWLKGVGSQLFSIRDHEHARLVDVRSWSDVPAGPPLFESMLVYESYPKRESFDLLRQGAAQISSFGGGGTRLGYPIVVTAVVERAALISVNYDRARFPGGVLDGMVEQMKVLLESMPSYADRPLSELPMLTGDERRKLVGDWSGAAQAVEEPPSHLLGLLAERSANTPGAIAIAAGEEQVDYRTLDQRVERLARRLRSKGAGPGSFVGLSLERSVDLYVGLLGILRSGAAYVPLDPGYPTERLAAMLSAADVKFIVTRSASRERLPLRDDQACVLVNADEDAHLNGDASPVVLEGDHPAYVIFTSGSTGTPNPVVVPHRSLAHYAHHAAESFELTSRDRVLQFASVNFDTAVEEIFPTLLRGATLVPRTDEMLASVAAFLEACKEQGITVLDLPTSYWHELARELSTTDVCLPQAVRLVIIGGERASADCVAAWREAAPSHVRLVNTYGPTEATVVATSCDLDKDRASRVPTGDTVPIGTPIAGVRSYVLDRYHAPLPVGVTGELFLAGSGLALGYHRLPASTAECFVPDPFSVEPGGRMYATGDLCRWSVNGRLEYCGRADQQVKLRGFRIELGECEGALERHPGVHDAAVVLYEEAAGSARLVAFVTTSGAEVSEDELRTFLLSTLPEHAVPSRFVTLSELPRTRTGKLDREALPAGSELEPAAHGYLPPRTEVEETVALAFAEALGLERVGVLDNFFAIGGHSLLTIRLWSKLNETFQVSLSLRTLVEDPTVEAIALAIEETLLAEIGSLSDEDAAALQESDA
jgi:amino acid adenylation domain-containing protein